MFVKYNSNPQKARVGDCVVRAISTALDSDWESIYIDLADMGLKMGDMPSSNHVWGTYLYNQGFDVELIHNFCPDCYTVREFAEDHPEGTFILGTGTHAVAVIDGDWIDTFDSAEEVPIYYFTRRREEYGL